ncbi:MAG: hypothetical protein IKI75_13255 [Lachnospiraceae bacterium]|nr:hypothetical protein [Lachnospiraceae bacterium]
MSKKKKKNASAIATAKSLGETSDIRVIGKEDAGKQSRESIKGADAAKNFDIRELLPVALLLALELFFWRNIIFTDNLLGDLGDGRFTALVTEHWWKFFTGKESFGVIPIFHPNTIALGYSDLHLGFGIFHSVFRLLGMDLYLAFKWSVFMLHLLGLVTMYIMLRGTLKLKVVWSLFGTVAYSHCCALAAVSNHPQLFAAGMLPLLFILFAGFVRNFEKRKKRNIYAYIALFWFVLLTYTSWYMACFTGIFCLVFIIVYLIMMARTKNGIVKPVKNWIGTMKWDIIGYIVYTVILFIPFFCIYIPVMKEGSMYSYSGYYLPDPVDLINVTENNLMFGWLMKFIKIGARGRDHEVAEGFSPVALVMFIVIMVSMFSKKRMKKSMEDIVPKATAISVLVCILLLIRWDGADGSLWAVVYEVLPPARAVHAVARFMLWLCFPMSAVTAYWADRMQFFENKGRGRLGAFVVCGLMVFSTICIRGLSTSFTHMSRQEFIDSVTQAPEEAQSFYITDSALSGDPQFVYQLDAYEVAEKTGIPTLNGYSGHFPGGWSVWDVCGADYETYAAYWAQEHGLTNVYAYDRATNSWSAR